MKHWFLPRSPDVLALLHGQAAVTVRGMEAFTAWSSGDAAQADPVRDAKHEAADRRRELQAELRAAFSVPLDAEDIYELSERLAAILNGAADAIRESEVMAMSPDPPLGEMARSLLNGVRLVQSAFTRLSREDDGAINDADAAIVAVRDVEHVYRAAMSSLLATPDIRELLGRRELYRRYARLADAVRRAAERVWYAVVKQG